MANFQTSTALLCKCLILYVISFSAAAQPSVYGAETGVTNGVRWSISWVEPPVGTMQAGDLLHVSWEVETTPAQLTKHSHIHLCHNTIDACKQGESGQFLPTLRGRTESGLIFEYIDAPQKRAEIRVKPEFKSGD